MCEHASNSPEDCLLQLDDTRTSFRCVAHAPLPIPRQRDDDLDLRAHRQGAGRDAGTRYERNASAKARNSSADFLRKCN